MKLHTFYERAISKALKEDPRPKKTIEEQLRKNKRKYRKLKGLRKKAFDRESLKHPYADSRILYSKDNVEIKTVLVGIDIDVQELLLAEKLKEKGIKIDLVLSHHPSGRAYAQLNEVMSIQPGIWETFGFDKQIAKDVMKDKMGEVFRGISARNHTRALDAARLLDMPFMCLHTAADNCVASYLSRLFRDKKPKKLKRVLSLLESMPEYKHAMKMGAGPYVLSGEEKSDAGKIFVDMTGGTSPPERIFARLSQSGVKTIVGMHAKEPAFKAVKSEFLNYVIAGHISSDTLGVNLLLDAVDPKGNIKVIECSGFRRFRR